MKNLLKHLKKFLVCFIIVTLVIAPLKIQKPKAIAITASAGLVVAGLLVASGVVFNNSEDIQNAVTHVWNEYTTIQQQAIDIAGTVVNGVADISTSVWEGIRDFVQDNFFPGENVNEDYIQQIPYEYQEWGDGLPPSPTALPNQYIRRYTVSGVVYATLVASTGQFYYRYYQYQDTWRCSATAYRYSYNSNTGVWSGIEQTYAANTYNLPAFNIATKRNCKFYASDLVTEWGSTIPWVNTYSEVQTDIPYQGRAVLSNPTYDFVDNNVRQVAIPQSYETLVGMTELSVSNPAYDINNPAGTPASELNTEWWDKMIGGAFAGLAGVLTGLFGGLSGLVENVWDKLQEIYLGLFGANGVLSDILTGITDMVDSLTDAKDITEAEIEAAAAQDLAAENTIKNYKIPDLFILLMQVLIASINVVIIALMYIITLPLIPQDSSWLNDTMETAIDFIKGQTIPVLNINFWTLFSATITMLFALAIFKRIRRHYKV